MDKMKCNKCGLDLIENNPYYKDLFAFSVMLDKNGKSPSPDKIKELHKQHIDGVINHCKEVNLCSCNYTNE